MLNTGETSSDTTLVSPKGGLKFMVVSDEVVINIIICHDKF